MTKKQPPSLRRRYIGLTLILGIIVIGFVVNVYINLSEKNRESTQTLAEIDSYLNIIENIRSESSTLYQSVNVFLQHPDNEKHLHMLNQSLKNTTEQSLMFKLKKNGDKISFFSEELFSKINKISPLVTQLIEIRRDPNKQYPGMSLSANIMAEQQNTLKGLLKLLQEEINNGDYIPKSKSLLSEILESRILVEKEISQVRIYIANRLALFSNEILINQANSLTEINLSFVKKIDILLNIYQSEEESFEGLPSINKIKSIQTSWYNNFIILRKLSESDHWREDSHLMENKISPLFDQISKTIFNANQYLHQQKKQTTESFNETSKELFYILSVIIGLFLLYIFMIQVSMEYMVFKPILNIADVMKLKAFGDTDKQFSNKQSQETQNIVTAFNELEHKVISRTEKMKTAITKSQKAVKEAKIANQAKSIFLANMSHELRTPLHGILSFADLGSSKVGEIDDEKAKQYFDLITESGQRLLLLLNDLLDLEKLESGRVELQLKDNSLNKTTLTVINQLKALSDRKHIQITIDNESNPENTIYDNEKIIQVIHNLLSNAIKFSPENTKIIITLTTTRIDNENMAVFIVDDSGIGIPDDELDKVFDKFIQSSKTQTGAGGTGLGLSICHEIIKAHHGLIRAEKKSGKGARFVFYIPLIQKNKNE